MHGDYNLCLGGDVLSDFLWSDVGVLGTAVCKNELGTLPQKGNGC